MSNRRMGGPRGGNRGFSQHFQSGVNPWQGGSNNMNHGGIISQLTSTPQLALALTSLLQQQPQQQPPSLLSLNTSPAYSNSRDIGRFGNRGRDSRRHEPYNKNRGGWRSDKGRRRSPRRNDKKAIDKKDAKKVDETTESAEDGNDDEKESKRDWKDEKNTGDAKEESGDEAKKAQEKEGKFVGVPPKFLNCFVCNKQMWDGQSMGKHLKGRAHHEMIKALEESIHICVNILRENMRLSEERKMIELNRQNRLKRYGGKKHFVEPNSHCNMCDLKFMGKIVTHRRSEGHQRLKSYLHPTCRICEKEFPSRLEWIEHRLTPEHLKKLHEVTEKNIGDGAEVVDANAEVESEQDVDLEPLLEEPLQMESENPIMEIEDVLDGLQNRIPSYKQDRAVGTKSLKAFTGFVCELCNRSFVDEQDSQDHLKSKRHYYKFVEALREQFERRERRRKEEEERKKKEEAEAAAAATAEVNTSVKEENQDDSKENGDQAENEDEESEANDQEMYDPEEHTEDNAEEPAKSEPIEEVKAEPEVKEPEAKPKPEPEAQPEVKEPVKEALVEPATPSKGTPRKAAVRNGAGPKSKRARK